MAIGNVLGALAGYRGGMLDSVVMRWVHLMSSIPPLLVALVVAGVLGGGYWMAVLLLLVLTAPYDTRVVRAAVLEQRGRAYVEAARICGVPERRIYQMERSRAIYTRKHHGAVGEYTVRGLTAAAFATRAAVAKALLTVPGGSRVKQLDPSAPAQFMTHVKAAVDPDARPGIEEAAADFNERVSAG